MKETSSDWDKRQASLILCIFADGINKTAYMNDQLFLKYIQLYLISPLEGRPTLFALNLCRSHKTPAVLESLRKQHILFFLIPTGCTRLVQSLDVTIINKPLKETIRNMTDEAIRECETSEFEKWTVSDRRILTAWSVYYYPALVFILS